MSNISLLFVLFYFRILFRKIFLEIIFKPILPAKVYKRRGYNFSIDFYYGSQIKAYEQLLAEEK